MDGNIVKVNTSFKEMLGYSEEELRHLTYQQITPAHWHDIEGQIVQEQIIPRGFSDEYEKEYIRKDGSIFPISIRTWLIKDKLGQPQGMWAIVRDITERKRAEEALRERGGVSGTGGEREQYHPADGPGWQHHLFQRVCPGILRMTKRRLLAGMRWAQSSRRTTPLEGTSR